MLPVAFFRQPTAEVARQLLGAVLVSTIDGVTCTGRIVETEAYLGHVDPASHAFALRRTVRNAALFGPAGDWYVYLSYGLHWCANLVCEGDRQGGAVLLRALEPLEGREAMAARRGVARERLLCSGPGRLAQALGMSLAQTGVPMRRSEVRVLRGEPLPERAVVRGPRIGITRAADWPLRFTERGSRWLSRP
jgi:DNA-3-methyladenine glycosylase